jgi:hypothetical protein
LPTGGGMGHRRHGRGSLPKTKRMPRKHGTQKRRTRKRRTQRKRKRTSTVT